MICIRDIIVCLHFTRCIGYVGGVCVPTLQYAVSESKYYMYMTNSDDVQILDYICWQKCVMRPEEFSNVWHECSESKDYGIPIAACLCVSAFSWIRLLRSGSGTMQRRSALKEFPFDLESTLLPQTHIFTVWMNLNFCVCTLLNTLAGSFFPCVVLSLNECTHIHGNEQCEYWGLSPLRDAGDMSANIVPKDLIRKSAWQTINTFDVRRMRALNAERMWRDRRKVGLFVQRLWFTFGAKRKYWLVNAELSEQLHYKCIFRIKLFEYCVQFCFASHRTSQL